MTGKLTKAERVFLAGCIKSMLLADGSIEPQEIAELDVLTKKLDFADFDECLSELEASVSDDEAFWAMATRIARPSARAVILQALDAVLLHEGIPTEPPRHFIDQLKRTWAANAGSHHS